jgi:glycolate oxidase iron-sulfur subunit
VNPGKSLLKALDYSVLQQCMHCGLCLPSCPTYLETGRERHSPRGRISLMRAIADGELGVTRGFAEEMDYCLGCLACTSACPAGVDYGELFEASRAEVQRMGVVSPPLGRLQRWLTLRFLLTRPRALRAAARILGLYEATGLRRLLRRSGILSLLPGRLAELERQALPIRPRFSDALIAEVERPRGPVTHRVLVLTGCIQDISFSDVNRATVDVLLENGCEVTTPRLQGCCGSLHAHNGDPGTARLLARRQLDAVDPSAFDAIISNSAGCGSHVKHYGSLLEGDPAYAARALAWSRKVRDISEWLVETGFRPPRTPGEGAPPAVAATYHEACHLCHGQGISSQPRQVLRSIPGLELSECPEATLCCGSAGIYSITQPRTSAWLRDRKVGHLLGTGARVVATANPGCQLQIQNGLRNIAGSRGTPPRVAHPIVLLAEAYAREASPAA